MLSLVVHAHSICKLTATYSERRKLKLPFLPQRREDKLAVKNKNCRKLKLSFFRKLKVYTCT
jgi:hypothetical protein